ncbi:hypothetical protein B296_00043351 [Ensete ventricosum]|uniref:RRM domain-containing protein n=1 Tax=Ensete ventricosum TaxID=4639 RepID=A0A426YFM3_ENSVE|nr:hypothetical protein B296_00043351 [Ensete ventricosum]
MGLLLPDDEEALLSGIMDDFDLSGLPGKVDELEDYDLFGNLGGMELDSDPTESITVGMAKASISDGFLGNVIGQYSLPNSVGAVSGEHPYGEHPSRTLFVRNINSNVEDSELQLLFEIRETPHKRNHKFIEFYDVRAAEAALRSLNKSDIAGKRIKLEPSRPVFSQSQNGLAMSPIVNDHLPGIGSVVPPMLSTSVKIAPIGKDQTRLNHADHIISSSSLLHGGGYQHSHSFPDHSCGGMTSASGNLASFGSSTPNSSGVGTLTGPQFLWGKLTSYTENTQSSVWQPLPTGSSFMSNGQGQGQSFLYSSSHGSFLRPSHNQNPHHVGSAPSVVPFQRQYGYFPESAEPSFMNHFALGNIGINRKGVTGLMNMTPHPTLNQGIISGSMSDNNSPNVRMMSAQRPGPTLFGNAPYPALNSIGIDGLVDWHRSRRVDNHGSIVVCIIDIRQEDGAVLVGVSPESPQGSSPNRKSEKSTLPGTILKE